MITYFQALNNYPINSEGATALLQFRKDGANIALFEKPEEIPLRRDVMVVGGIEPTHYWFKEMGWETPPSITLPFRLASDWWTGRKISKMTYGEARAKTEYPFFVKSFQLKKFDPFIVKSAEDKKWFDVANAPNKSTEVLVSEVIDFKSEYRVYVLEGKVVGICYYNGDHQYYPDYDIICQMIRQYDDAPKFYSLDVGIVLSGRLQFTRLVECNDGYSLGNYGLSPKMYKRGLVTRWRELLDQNPVKISPYGAK